MMGNRILLADDSITIQKVVNLTFADEGIEVVAVSNGDMAERRLSEINPDIVLADIFMPGKNGYELCQYIKENPTFHHVPVVLLVGAFEPFDQAEAKRVQADAHLTKPFESRTLVETVRRLIESSRPTGAGTSKASDVTAQSHSEPVPVPTTQELPAFDLSVSSPADGASQEFNPPLSFSFGDSSFQDEASPAEVAQPFADQLSDTFDGPATGSSPAAIDGTFDLGDFSFQNAESSETTDAGFGDSFGSVGADNATRNEQSGFGVPSTFGQSASDTVLDFEQVEPPDHSVPAPNFAFETEGSASTAIDAGEGGLSFSWPGDSGTGPVVEAEPAPFVESSNGTDPETGFEFQVASEAAPGFHFPMETAENAALEPSSDVVTETDLDGVAHPSGWAEEPAEAAPGVPLGVPFEFRESSSAPAEPELSTAAGSVNYSPSAAEPVDEPAPTVELSEIETPSAPSIFERFSPPDAAADKPVEDEVEFTSADLWSQEKTKFAPLDIGSLPASETIAADGHAVGESETGFELAEVLGDESGFAIVPPQSAPAEPESTADSRDSFKLSAVSADRVAAAMQTPVGSSAPEPEKIVMQTPEVSEAGPPTAFELPETVIDEIVRRVVAQLSENVVREIAWEVVPDCVERIIEKVASELALKKV